MAKSHRKLGWRALARLAEEARQRDNYRCKRCRSRRNLEAHHIVPLAKGGKHELANIQTLCRSCHIALHGGPMYKERKAWEDYSGAL